MYMKIVISENQFEKLIKKVKDGERFIKCDTCKKWFTQTFHKGKKSLPICPWCGRHNTQFNENQEVDERSRSFAFTRKKRLFSKAEIMANPDRYRPEERDLDEIGTYKFDDHPKAKTKPGEDEKEFKDAKNDNLFYKKVGKFEYLYTVKDMEGMVAVTITVIDTEKELKVAVADFDLRGADDFFVALPIVRPEYRNQGIAIEMYKIILDFGNLVSGRAQSQYAVGLWKKMYRVLPNKMVYVDDNGKEHEIEFKNDKFIIANTGEDVHKGDGGYLKLYKTK